MINLPLADWKHFSRWKAREQEWGTIPEKKNQDKHRNIAEGLSKIEEVRKGIQDYSKENGTT